MFQQHYRKAAGLVIILAAASGCDGRNVTSPTARPDVTPPPLSNPSATSIFPAAVSTKGGARVILEGSGLDARATVTIGGETVPGRFDSRFPGGTTLIFVSPPGIAGPTDVVVTNPDGRQARLSDAFLFVSPEALDFDGVWQGFGDAGQDIPLEIVIERSQLIRASCDQHEVIARDPIAVAAGEFVFATDDGVRVTGRIAAADQAVGTMELGACTATTWRATKVR